MDEMQNNSRPVNPRRKQRSQLQIFKEAYLPVIIVGIALVLILIFIIGGIVRGVQRSKHNAQLAQEASIAEQQKLEQLNDEAAGLIAQAEVLAKQCDYDSAISMLDSFSGDMTAFPQLAEKRAAYEKTKESLVLWNDPAQVVSLSFQHLIADTARAFKDAVYGDSYNKNYVTCEEFSKILVQLYENGYMLVSLSDIVDENGAKDLYLPNGKKPLLLTQTNVNYNNYMVDSDGDKLPDAGGAGFANKLVFDDNGSITCQMVDSSGNTVTGNYDLGPILNDFISAHPDFSYRGAKAILALTGYDGVFGYRTDPDGEEFFGKAHHQQEVDDATEMAATLRDMGYELACYTYENEPYGSYTAQQIQDEMTQWTNEVTSIIGQTDVFVFSRLSDIADNGAAYTGEKYNALQSAGFRYYLGFCQDAEGYYGAYNDHIRLGRILVTGGNMAYNASWFEGIFDAASVLDKTRGTVPG